MENNSRGVRAKRWLATYWGACRDKCRAVLVGLEGEYIPTVRSISWLKFAEVDYDDFRRSSLRVRLTTRLLRGSMNTLKNVHVPKSLPGTIKNATCT